MNRPVRIRTCVAVTLAAVVTLSAATDNLASIEKNDLKGWLSYIASDELEGRGLYSAGLGLAAAYIENHLRTWGAKPAGDNGSSYLQTVRVLGVRSTGQSTVTVEIGGQTRTFAEGSGVTFPKMSAASASSRSIAWSLRGTASTRRAPITWTSPARTSRARPSCGWARAGRRK